MQYILIEYVCKLAISDTVKMSTVQAVHLISPSVQYLSLPATLYFGIHLLSYTKNIAEHFQSHFTMNIFQELQH